MYKLQNKGQILLSVVVSCKGKKSVLKENLKALSFQNLDRKLWNPIFILGEKQKHSNCVFLIHQYFSSAQILFLSKYQPVYEMKNLVFHEDTPPYIYFIDEDVILEAPGHLSRLLELHRKYSEATVLGGSYLDHPKCAFWGRSYNWVARLWTKNQTCFVPAGNLSIKTGRDFKARFYSPNPFGFGGEEIYFLQSLQSEGHRSYWRRELDAKHLALHSLKDFIKRAWFHGASLAFEKASKRTSYFLFFKEPAPVFIKLAALCYLLLVRLSFCFYKIITIAK